MLEKENVEVRQLINRFMDSNNKKLIEPIEHCEGIGRLPIANETSSKKSFLQVDKPRIVQSTQISAAKDSASILYLIIIIQECI